MGVMLVGAWQGSGTSGCGFGAVAALGTNLWLWALSLHLLHEFNPLLHLVLPSQQGFSLFQQLLWQQQVMVP